MAIEDLNISEDIDQMVNAEDDLKKTVADINPTANPAVVKSEGVPMKEEELVESENMLNAEPTFIDEGATEVAGILPDSFKKAIKEFTNISDKNKELVEKRSKLPAKDQDYVIIPDGSQADEVISKTKVKGPKNNETPRFNVNQINDTEGVKEFINVVGDVYLGKKQVMSTKALADELSRSSYTIYKEGKKVKTFSNQAEVDVYLKKQKKPELFTVEEKRPYSPDFIAKVTDPAYVTQANPADIYKILMAQLDATNTAEGLARKVIAAGDNVNDELIVEFNQALALAGELSKVVDKTQADVGRSLRIFGEVRTGSKDRMREFIKEVGDGAETHSKAKAFLLLKDTEDKARFGKTALTLGGVKDIWYATWINMLLSSPLTHAKNTAANFMFGAYQVPEKYLTSVVGKIRTTITGQKEYLTMNSVNTYVNAYYGSHMDGVRAGVKAFIDNAPSDGVTKLELDKIGRRHDPFDVDFGKGRFAKAASDATALYGKFVTLPGRLLVAEDEFFKLPAYMGSLRMQIAQKGDMFYNSRIDAGIDPEVAKKMSIDFVADLTKNTPQDMIDNATAAAKELTFTKELDGVMGELQAFVQQGTISPVMRMFFPFVRTPTNLVAEALKRTPLQLLKFGYPPKLIKALKTTSGPEFDAAVAKMTLGSTMIGSVGYAALGGKLTGSGPTNRKLNKTLQETGWQPYSLVFTKDQLSTEDLKFFTDRTSVSVSENKYYISYQGLQPISTLIAMGATIGEYMEYTSRAGTRKFTSKEQAEQITQAAVLGIYESITDLPMLSGYADFTDILQGDPKDAAKGLRKIIEKSTIKLTEFAIGGSPAGPIVSSGSATIERIMSPGRSNTLLPDPASDVGVIEGGARGFNKAFQKMTARIPYYSDGLPDLLHPLTGNPITIGKGNTGEAFNPFKRSDGKVAAGVRALLSLSVPIYEPPRSLQGYELSAQQYNDWIVLATNGGQLEVDIIDEVDTHYDTVNLLDSQRAISRVMTDAYSDAMDDLADIYPEISIYLENIDLEMQDEGMYDAY